MKVLAISSWSLLVVLATAPFGDAFGNPSNRVLSGSNQIPVSSGSFLNGRYPGMARQPTLLFMEDGPKPPSLEPPEDLERPKVPVPLPPPTPKRNLTPEEEKLMVASAIGGLFVGGFLGGVVDLQNPDIDLYVSPVIPPAIGALSLSAFGFVAGGSDGSLGNIVRKSLGGTTIAVGNGIVAVIRNAADSAATAAKNKVKETADEIKAIPSNIQKAAVKKVEETKEEIIAIPGKIQEAARETASEIAEEIKATPGRVAESTKRAVEDAVDDTLDAVEEFVDDVKALPQKALSEVEEQINSLLGKDSAPRPPLAPPKEQKTPRRKERTPGPPKALPPIEEETKPLIPRIETLKIEPPRLELPNIEPPKIEVPKIVAPKIEVPKINLPKPPAVKPPPQKTAQTDSVPDNVKLKSGKKDIFFDEKTGRFFEGGKTPPVDAPKFEVPKLELPKLEVPTLSLPKVEPKSSPQKPQVDFASERKAAKLGEEKQKAQEAQQAAQEAAALKRKQEAEARAEEARQRKKEAERQKAEAAEKARQAAEERKRAQEQARQEKLEEQARAAELRQQQVEERRKQVEAIRQAQLEKNQKAKEARQSATLKAQRQQAVEKSLDASKSRTTRTTISLAGLFGLGSSDEDSSPTVPVPAGSKAPPGVPTINNWKQNPDGSITGKISGSANFAEDEAVTTSPVSKGASSGTVVMTSSGSRYYLGSKGGGFGFSFGASSPATAPAAVSQAVDPRAEARRIAEEKKASAQAAAEKRRQEAEERKAAAAAAAEERKAAADAQRRAAEERKAAAQAAAEEKRAAAAAAAEERKAAAEAQKRAAEERKAAAEAAAEEKRRAVEERQAAMAAAVEAKKRDAEERQAAMAAVAEEKRKAAEARRAAAIAAAERRKTPPTPSVESPPNGVPVIKSWKRRPDGGVSGRIYNSRSFSDGDFVETSPITRGELENGSVVATKSGSRYFLSAEPAVKNSNILAAIKDLAGAEPGATITLTRERKEKEAKAAQEAIEKARPRSTFSLFGLGFGDATDSPSPVPAPKPAPKQSIPNKVTPAPKTATAPRGVPTVSRWKKNGDGSITGVITGSKAFKDGERVTTSPIKNGTIAKNEVVITGSGSKYFLA